MVTSEQSGAGRGHERRRRGTAPCLARRGPSWPPGGRRRALAALGGLLLSLLGGAPAPAGADPFAAPFRPVESGYFDPMLGLEVSYAMPEDPALGTAAARHLVTLALQGKLVLGDRVQLGAYLVAMSQRIGAFMPEETELGNTSLTVKVALPRLGSWAWSTYLNTTLPTASGLTRRDLVMMQVGTAASRWFSSRHGLGAATGAYLMLDGSASTSAVYHLDLWALLSLSAGADFQLALQMGLPVAPATDVPGLATIAGFRFHPYPHLEVDLGAFVALTEGGRFFTSSSRVGALFRVRRRF